MGFLTTAAILAALAAAAPVVQTGIDHGIKYWGNNDPANQDDLSKIDDGALLAELKAAGFTDSELTAMLKQYAGKDVDAFKADYKDMLASMGEYEEIESGKPSYANIYDKIAAEQSTALSDLYAQLDADLASRQNLLNEQLGMYNTQLSDISNDYNRMRSDIQANQYRQNAQLMDTLQSGMEKSRRNALEAGASAGIRIADNINTLLSVQNKQSNSAMETANQLSQMMINQRNAEHGIYNSMYDAKNAYANAASQNIHDKQTYKANYDAMTESKAQSAYDRAYSSYNDRLTDWDNSMSMNPLYDVRNTLKKRYTPTKSSQSETGGT